MSQAVEVAKEREEVADEAESASSMSLGEHLEALRQRLIRGLIGIAVFSVLTMYFGRSIVAWLCEPLFAAQRELGLPQQAINLSVAGGFSVYVKVSFLAGLVLGIPWAAFQLWKFVAPGLRQNEQKAFRIVAPYSTLMTVGSVLFTYYLFLPAAVSFLLLFSLNYPIPHTSPDQQTSLQHVTSFFNKLNGYLIGSNAPAVSSGPAQSAHGEATTAWRVPIRSVDPDDARDGDIWLNPSMSELRIKNQGQIRVVALTAPTSMVPQVEINEYLDFVFMIGLIMIVAFQTPVVMTVAAMFGMFDPRALARYRKAVVFCCFLAAIVVTPNQDIVSNVVFPFLLWGLFEVGLVTSRLMLPKEQ